MTMIHILDCLFPVLTAGQIHVNDRPVTTFFGQVAFKKQIHPNGIRSCDVKRIANRAISSRTSPSSKNAILMVESDNVPVDHSISGEAELFNQRQLAPNMPLDPPLQPLVSPPRILPGAGTEKLIHLFA